MPEGTQTDIALSVTGAQQLAAAFDSLAAAGRRAGRAIKATARSLREASIALRHHRLSRGQRRHVRRMKAAGRAGA